MTIGNELRYCRGFRWIEQRTNLGESDWIWRRVVLPRIDDIFLDCSVYLYASAASAQEGNEFGGSGSVIRLKSELGNFYHHYAVTNRHVIKPPDPSKHGSPVIRLNSQDGKTRIEERRPKDWYCCENQDLAVCPLGLWCEGLGFRAINTTNFLNLKIALDQNIGIGDDVFLVGRFINHDGKQRNLPTARFGSISMMPHEDEWIPHPDFPDGQEAFLVEVRTRSGYSGSPVFVYRTYPPLEVNANPYQATIAGTPLPGSSPIVPAGSNQQSQEELLDIARAKVCGPWLLGIHCGQITRPERIDSNRREEEYIKLETGMAVVVPAWRLQEFLDTEELVMQRKKEIEQKKVAMRTSVTLESAEVGVASQKRLKSETLASLREKLRDAASDSGLTQEEIGVRMGYRRNSARKAVSRLLNLETDHNPRLSTLLAFADAIGRPLKELL